MKKVTTWNDISRASCVKAPYMKSEAYSEQGKSYAYITCPFCLNRTKAFIWSLNGCGKRCETKGCGALFSNTGMAYSINHPM